MLCVFLGNAGKAPGNGGNDLAPTPSVFPFFGGLRRPVALVAGARAFSCVLAERAGHRRLRQRPVAAQGDSQQSSPLARRGIVWSFRILGGKDHGAQRSGPRPGNEVFALLGRTGTGQCPVVAACDWLLPPCRFGRPWRAVVSRVCPATLQIAEVRGTNRYDGIMTEHDPRCPCCVSVEDVKFSPWRGSSYDTSPIGIKILVMGESTYEPREYEAGQFKREYECLGSSWFPHKNLLAYSEGLWSDPHFASKWIGLFLDRPPRDLEDRKRVVNSVAFWNYADVMLTSSGKPPGKGDLKTANRKLRSVLSALQPRLVVFLSTRLWSNLAEGCDPFDQDRVKETELYEMFEMKDLDLNFLHFPHPRGRYWKNDMVRSKFRSAIVKLDGKIPSNWVL